jgi:hypothetical protein
MEGNIEAVLENHTNPESNTTKAITFRDLGGQDRICREIYSLSFHLNLSGITLASGPGV